MGDQACVEYGVLRRAESGHILWITLYGSEADARNHATPLDSVEVREVGAWRKV